MKCMLNGNIYIVVGAQKGNQIWIMSETHKAERTGCLCN